MDRHWVGCDQHNYRAGRSGGLRPDMIVLHSARGSVADATRAFLDPAAGRSAHYVVARDGSITQHVQETDTAFHAGIKVNPVAPLVVARPSTNPNFYSVGIEHEGSPADAWPQPQIAASAALIAEIAARWRIPLDEAHVVTHDAIRASAGCPGAGCDLPRLLAAARALPGETVFAAPLELTLTSRANIRRSPDVSNAAATVAAAGQRFTASGVTHGQAVDGNDWWYVDASGRYLWAGATDQPSPDADDGDLSTDEMSRPQPPAPAGPPPAAAPAPAISRAMALDTKDYVAVATPKDLIVLHFTAGPSARSAFDTWRQDPKRIATAYIVDVDGTIYETFDPRYWASHLGIKGAGTVHEKRSIGIEIANFGPLTPSADGTSLNAWTGKAFCSRDERQKYRERAYRGFNHYAAFPAAQSAAVGSLVRSLTERFSIPRMLPGVNRREEFDETFFATFKGIATHANFRRDKFDIGPAFDWDGVG